MKARRRADPTEARVLGAYVALMRAAEGVTARAHAHLAARDLTVGQFGALEALFHLGPMRPGDLSRKLLRSPGNMTVVLGNLESRGLVRRETLPDDRRCTTVSLTREGTDLVRAVFPKHVRALEKELSVLTAAEQEELRRLCRKLGIGRSDAPAHFDHGWLDTYHTFSFGDYYDPEHVGFRSLRVVNEDRVAPGQGFGAHPHRDMEIVTIVFEGAIEHRDSLGNGETLRPGEVQRMTAGTGVVHSEFNPSATEPLHLLQIWIRPERAGLAPGYEQKAFPESERRGRFRLVASRDARDGSLTIHQDASVYVATAKKGDTLTHPLAAGRHGFLHVVRGAVTLNGGKEALRAGDAAALSGESAVAVAASEDAELLLFDLA
jgi:redox-sensitive bicupin YhaK (pirin superfamily)/DNA-binding MarR family transcriptional regulator